jgi:hypothetical protein
MMMGKVIIRSGKGLHDSPASEPLGKFTGTTGRRGTPLCLVGQTKSRPCLDTDAVVIVFMNAVGLLVPLLLQRMR